MTLQRPITQYADSDGLKIAYSYCRACRADYKQAHYAANKRRYITNAARRRGRLIEENVRRILQFFESHPCVDCGEGDALVLEFDHVGDKSFSIGSAIRDRPWAAIEREMAVCEVVCANCHRKRTARRGGWARFTALDREPNKECSPSGGLPC